jgi:hypothetical protein
MGQSRLLDGKTLTILETKNIFPVSISQLNFSPDNQYLVTAFNYGYWGIDANTSKTSGVIMVLSTGTIIHQRYRVVNLLGQGGFGAVYRAWDLNLSRPCGFKRKSRDISKKHKNSSPVRRLSWQILSILICPV